MFQHVNNVSQQMYFDVGKMEFYEKVLGAEVLLAAVGSEVLSLSAVLSETDVLSVWLSETSAADAVDVLLSETAEVPDADDVLLPVDAVLPQAVSDIAAARKSAAHFFSFLSFFPVI